MEVTAVDYFISLTDLKKPKKYEEGGLMPIYMRVSVGGKRTEFTTQREWDPTKWHSSACRASGTKEASKELNAFLDTLQTKVYEALYSRDHRLMSPPGPSSAAQALFGSKEMKQQCQHQQWKKRLNRLQGADFITPAHKWCS